MARLATTGMATPLALSATGSGAEPARHSDVVAGGYTVVPGDGTAHFGLALSNEPPVCTAGYGGTRRTNPSQTRNLPPVNTAARCTLPRGSAASVRGEQNAPGPGGSTNSTVPLAFGDQPVAPGAAASLGTAEPEVSVPLPPSTTSEQGGDPSWLWIMKEAAR